MIRREDEIPWNGVERFEMKVLQGTQSRVKREKLSERASEWVGEKMDTNGAHPRPP